MSPVELERFFSVEPQPVADEMHSRRKSAAKIVKDFPATLAAAQAECDAFSPDKIVNIIPSNVRVADLTIAEVARFLDLYRNGNTPIPPAGTAKAAADARRKLAAVVQAKRDAENFLRDTAPEPVRRRLAQLQERRDVLAHAAEPLGRFTEATSIVKKLEAEDERRRNFKSYTRFYDGPSEEQLAFDMAHAKVTLSRIPSDVLERARAAAEELDSLAKAIAAVETEMLVP